MEEQLPKIKLEELRIEIISPIHETSNFKSYEPELVDFLIEDALDNQQKKISTTYLWFHKPTNELAGYVTVLADAINLQGELKEYFRQAGIFYRSLPALKIGRLCVSDDYLGRGIGTLMIEFAIILAEKIGKDIGLRFITTDAKRNPDPRKDSIHFYKKFGFEILKQREKGTIPLYKDLIKK
ncbi:GNAT family N-acetyltransferase [Candidatus Woesearchaeota archaeon]|nr:GNAT family N-acetyltransferase [Candidatus Woesearchaeota archaeon]